MTANTVTVNVGDLSNAFATAVQQAISQSTSTGASSQSTSASSQGTSASASQSIPGTAYGSEPVNQRR